MGSLHFGTVLPGRLPWAARGALGFVSFLSISLFLSATQRSPLYDVTPPPSLKKSRFPQGSKNSTWSLHFGLVLPGRLPWAARGALGFVSFLSISLFLSATQRSPLYDVTPP